MELLYFYSPGACSLSGQVVLEWIAIPYRLCRVERALRSSEAFKRINPQAKVPALKIGDRPLTENSAILLHLGHRKPEAGLLATEGTPERDTLHQWLSYLGTGFHSAFYPYFVPSRYIKDEALHPAIKEAAVEQIRRQVAFVDQHLEGRDHMLGERRSVLDPYLYAMSRWAKKLFDLPKEFPHLARHQSAMEQDPAVQFVLATERGEEALSPSGQWKGHVKLEEI